MLCGSPHGLRHSRQNSAVTITAAGIISDASVRGRMEFLASDAMNGRGSGTRDEWIAATCIASQVR